VNSISTGTEYRDTHLKSADFFDAENHPTVDFVSTSVKKVSDSEYVVNGDLTMRGATKQIALEVKFGGIAKDAYGNIKAGFEVRSKFKRKEFGVKLEASVQFAKVMVEETVNS
jgi:polyisoprenoid-binding protein YceI